MTRIGSISIIVLTIISLLAAGLPCYAPDASNVDQGRDLRNAIAHVQQLFTDDGDSGPEFASQLARVVHSMRILVNLDQTLSLQPHSDLSLITPQLDIPCILSFSHPLPFLPLFSTVLCMTLFFSSINVTPIFRPPAIYVLLPLAG